VPVAADARIWLGVSRRHIGSPTDTMVFALPVEWVLAGARLQWSPFLHLALNKFLSNFCSTSEFPALS
jgi:hypothetical protein